jgi:signal transduction histidine kinase
MSLILVLTATEIALSWSERSQLEDSKAETEVLARTLATFLADLSPDGNPTTLSRGFTGWSRQRITDTRAWVLVRRDNALVNAASSDQAQPSAPDSIDYAVFADARTRVRRIEGRLPGWLATTPLHGKRVYGVVDVRVSTLRLEDWARLERKRFYSFGAMSALLVALGVGLLTAWWVGRPLRELGEAMAGAHGGAGSAPPAKETGPAEFRTLARRYNQLREALAQRERESEARAALLNLEDRARNLDRVALMEETTAGFAHEIGTPLNTLSGHLQLLRDDLDSTSDGAGVDRVNLLLGQVDRVARIVRAGLERGKWPEPSEEGASLSAVAGSMCRFLQPSLEDAGVTLQLVEAPARARCDPHLVEQILLNLIKNSIEALRPSGHITVKTGTDADQAFVEVADDGPGLAPGARANLFNPFTTTKGTAGAGLGLAVSRRLARSMRGDLLYLPTARGTRWRLSLPAA